ncbi:ArsR/SmtB family transcription factor [Terriglobus sp.]|uniref:ArsR/SmtB family transcription factor n=1 Tax=Terriglobus sp. TaxID=1889013 RepID=UPI003B00B7C5
MSRKGKAKTGSQENAKPGSEGVAPSKPIKDKAALGEQKLVLVSKALSDPTRVSILRKIAVGQGRCGDVRECLGVSAATLSHHMKELERAGLITLQRDGRFVNAAIEKKAWKQHIAELKAMLP